MSTAPPTAPAAPPLSPAPPGRTGGWIRDLTMGARFAVTGGRESWARTLLTAIGVGLGVTLLLVTTALPNALAQRHDRERNRNDMTYTSIVGRKADDTMLVGATDTTYHQQEVRGRLLEPEGPKAPLPPGVAAFPAVGEMVVSPALKKLLASDDGALLRERLPYKITGTIGQSGLVGPTDLAYYTGFHGLRGSDGNGSRVLRINSFGSKDTGEGLDPVLLLLVVIIFVVLLMPVGVFIAAAVRFGGERRDRRLAALRLVGADARMARRIAAGESLAGAVLGLAVGTVLFLLCRQLAGHVAVFDVGVFPSDLTPTPALAVLVAVAVPLAAVVVTLFTLRNVVIEPLGVVRTSKPTRRRLWWRLLPPLVGLALLYPMVGQGAHNGKFNQWLVISGTVLLLIGVTALLPWIVEAVVTRLGGGGVAWQLAVRRLQLSSGTAARMVNGIAVAVAGAIALQMVFTGVQGDYTRNTGNDPSRAQMVVYLPRDADLAAASAGLQKTEGVRHTTALSRGDLADSPKDPQAWASLTVGTCAALREMAHLTTCHEGDTFLVHGAPSDMIGGRTTKPGQTLYLDATYGSTKGQEVPWRVPERSKSAESRKDPTGNEPGGVLATPSAVPPRAQALLDRQIYVRYDNSVPDVMERVRNTTAEVSPLAYANTLEATEQSHKYASIRTGLFVGAACVLALIGASLLVSQLEQLRERKKLLAALVAFGTRRRTLSLSVLWQTAIPIVLGLLLASAVGLLLGTVLLKMVRAAVSVDWWSVVSMAGIGGAVVLCVTLLSLPPLLRMMRPDGLRTE